MIGSRLACALVCATCVASGAARADLVGQPPRQMAPREQRIERPDLASAPGPYVSDPTRNYGAPDSTIPVEVASPLAGPRRGMVVGGAHEVYAAPPEIEEFADTPVDAATWQWFPDGLLYKQYLAGVREPRLATIFTYDVANDAVPWESMLGARVGFLRWGSNGVVGPYGRPDGWQWDVEGAGIPRLDLKNNRDLWASDFRVGTFLARARGAWESRFGYYHLSSHAGDEFILRTGFQRINYTRDVVVLGLAYRATPDLRLYTEGGYSFANGGGSKPLEFQFGVDYSPIEPTIGWRPAPFMAVNGHLREDVDFGGHFVAQAGLQWRSLENGHLFRYGLEYYNGKSRQLEFFNDFEHQVGMGIWYDY